MSRPVNDLSTVEVQNAFIKSWIPKVRRALIKNAARFNEGKQTGFVIRGRKSGYVRNELSLSKSIKSTTRKHMGAIESISFVFERHGVFVHKGAGRGYKVLGGVITRVAKSPVTKTRQKKEWFNPALDKYLPELADRVATLHANAAVNAVHMRIR